MPIVTGVASDEGLWQEIDSHFSCIFPAGQEPDAGLIAEVRNVMPNFVPIHMRLVYATPEQSVQYLDFVIAGRWVPYADEWKDPLRLERPYDFPFKGGVIYDQRTLGTYSLLGQEPPPIWKARGINELPLQFDRAMADWVIFAHKWFMCGDPVKKKAMSDESNRMTARLKPLREVQARAKEKLGEELKSPGIAMDAAWAASKGPNVSVQVSA